MVTVILDEVCGLIEFCLRHNLTPVCYYSFIRGTSTPNTRRNSVGASRLPSSSTMFKEGSIFIVDGLTKVRASLVPKDS